MDIGLDIETEPFNEAKGKHLRNVEYRIGAIYGEGKEILSKRARCLAEEAAQAGRIFIHNAPFDREGIKRQGAEIPIEKIYDTVLMCWLLDENNSCALKDVAPRYLNENKQEYSFEGIEDIDTNDEKLWKYVLNDARLAYRLGTVLEPKLKEQGLWDLYTKIDMPMMWVLQDATNQGMLVDHTKLAGLISKVTEETQAIKNKYIQKGLNINSGDQIWPYIYTDPELFNIPLKKNGLPKTDEKTLTRIRDKYPQAIRNSADEIFKYRKYTKLLNTFLEGLYNAREEDGLVHILFNLCVARTGRLSSGGSRKSYPKAINGQNIIKESESNPYSIEVRRSIIAPPGHKIVCVDAQQLEYVEMANYIGDEQLNERLNKGEDFHKATASSLFRIPIEQVTKEMRAKGKTLNFGTLYGFTPYGLSIALKCSVRQAEAEINDYYDKLPKLRQLKNDVAVGIGTRGYVRSRYGRRRRFPEAISIYNSRGGFSYSGEDEYAWKSILKEGFSGLIQGTAADDFKQCCIGATKKLPKEYKMFLQVHDEGVYIVPMDDKDAERNIKEAYESSCPSLPVKIKFEVSSGDNWGDAKG